MKSREAKCQNGPDAIFVGVLKNDDKVSFLFFPKEKKSSEADVKPFCPLIRIWSKHGKRIGSYLEAKQTEDYLSHRPGNPATNFYVFSKRSK